VNGYCERLTDAFWAEPANALTNLAFLLAAVVAARELRRAGSGRAPLDLVLLVAVLAAIGVGSFLFHTLSTPASALADTVPIALFILGYAVVFAHRFVGLRWSRAWLGAPLMLVLAVLVTFGTSGLGLPVPGPYLAALLALAGLTGWLASRSEPELLAHRGVFVTATVLFAVSLTLRQLDRPLCPVWPLGTHLGWHLCNAVVLGLLLRAAVRRAH
jgi:peptidoglycan/LPS O-acetylase OafA/YrhL